MALDRRMMMERQRDVFRVGMATTGLTFKQLAHRLDAGESTVRSWASGAAEMPLHVLDAAARAFPQAINLLFDDGLAIIAVPDGADHDGFAADHAAARHPASPAGVEISDSEHAALAVRRAGMGNG